MIFILSALASAILISLSILHFIWTFGGKWGFEHSIPTDQNGQKVLHPKKRDSAIVGFGLFFFAVFYQIKSGVVAIDLPGLVFSSAGWVIAAVFILRALGDFKYIGFFKRVRGTTFAKRDTLFYSPLCLLLGAIGVFLEILT